MAFQQGLSGLNAASKALDVTSNNVSNSGTVGYKSGQAHFADVYANALNGSGTSQTGIGTTTTAVQQQFTQGNITTTSNSLDISINGSGFYRMDTNGAITYSRAGQFHLDKNGYVIDDMQRKLTGYLADSEGIIVKAAPQDLLLSSANQAPAATGASGAAKLGVFANLNFDSRATAPTGTFDTTIPATKNKTDSYNFSTATTIYDSLGNAHTLTFYAVKVTPPAVVAAQATYDAAAATYAPFAAANTTEATNLATAQANEDSALAAIAAFGTPAPAAGTNAAYDAAVAAEVVTLAALGTAIAAADAAPTPPGSTGTMGTAFTDMQTAKTALAAEKALSHTPSQWTIHTSVDGTATANSGLSTPNTLSFDTSGKMLTTSGDLTVNINLNKVMGDQGQTNSAGSPLAFAIDFSDSTQFGSAFGTNSLTQDGYTSGRLTGVSVSEDGIISGNYSNGKTRNLGQVALASFTNPNGLTSLGGNQWAETDASGTALVGTPNSGTLGVLKSSTVEESNVDLTAELVNMITQQRNYQASAQSIKTQDQIMNTLVNLR